MAKINSRDLRLFNRNVFPLIPFVVLFFLCLVLMATDYRKQILKKIKKEAFVISSPITYLINLPVKIFRDSKDNFITKKILQEKIINLEQTNYELSIKAQENKLLASENKLLRDSLKIYKDFSKNFHCVFLLFRLPTNVGYLFPIHQLNLMYLGVFYLEASLQAKM